jgi:hypothetical protein
MTCHESIGTYAVGSSVNFLSAQYIHLARIAHYDNISAV